jgi:hypothetical protein
MHFWGQGEYISREVENDNQMVPYGIYYQPLLALY